MIRFLAALVGVSLSLSGIASAAPMVCEKLKGNVKFNDHVKIVFAVQENGFGDVVLPYCRVVAFAKPKPSSQIKIEVWIPVNNNGRYLQVGNGGFAGGINYFGLMLGVSHGYPTASTDDGAAGGDPGSFATNTDRRDDFAFRAIKETTDAAKAIIAAAIGSPPKRSYFHGCSEGGREALIEAQRYPMDFDGIIVGAPANNWTHQMVSFAWNANRVYADPDNPGPSLLPEAALKTLASVVLKQCRGKDGGLKTDDYLTDPRKCKLNFSKLCDDAGTCLTSKERAIVVSIYGGPRTSDGTKIFPGLMPGNEDHKCNWSHWITGQTSGVPCDPTPNANFQIPSAQDWFAVRFFKYFMNNMPIKNFDFDGGTHKTDIALGETMNADNADLTAFRKHGGKIIHYHGWADGAVAPENSVNYYTAVQKKIGGPDDFYRLFMAPGVSHCVGGVGPNAFGNFFEGADDAHHSVLRALERWVEEGKPPESIIATKWFNDDPKNQIVAERPLCPYPKIAKLVGSAPNAAASFKCAMP